MKNKQRRDGPDTIDDCLAESERGVPATEREKSLLADNFSPPTVAASVQQAPVTAATVPPYALESMPFKKYLAHPALNAGKLVLLARTPATLKLELDRIAADVEADTAALRMGKALHAALLEPASFTKLFKECDRTTKAGKALAESMENVPTITLLTPKEYAMVPGMAAAINGDKIARQICGADVQKEISLFWEDFGGIQCKARLDGLHRAKGILWDIKSSRDANPDSRRFEFQVKELGYDIKAAWYWRAAETVCQIKVKEFLWIVVENVPPHNLIVRSIAPETLDAAWLKIESLVARYRECVRTGFWPRAYAEEIVPLKLWQSPGDKQLTLDGEAM